MTNEESSANLKEYKFLGNAAEGECFGESLNVLNQLSFTPAIRIEDEYKEEEFIFCYSFSLSLYSFILYFFLFLPCSSDC